MKVTYIAIDQDCVPRLSQRREAQKDGEGTAAANLLDDEEAVWQFDKRIIVPGVVGMKAQCITRERIVGLKDWILLSSPWTMGMFLRNSVKAVDGLVDARQSLFALYLNASWHKEGQAILRSQNFTEYRDYQ